MLNIDYLLIYEIDKSLLRKSVIEPLRKVRGGRGCAAWSIRILGYPRFLWIITLVSSTLEIGWRGRSDFGNIKRCMRRRKQGGWFWIEVVLLMLLKLLSLMWMVVLLLLHHHLHSKSLSNIKHVIPNKSSVYILVAYYLLLGALSLSLRGAILVKETLPVLLQNYNCIFVIYMKSRWFYILRFLWRTF